MKGNMQKFVLVIVAVVVTVAVRVVGSAFAVNSDGDGVGDAVDLCPRTAFPGDGVDGPALLYVDHGDGTITDCNTGLMWEKKVPGGDASVTCLTDLHGVDSTCTFVQAAGVWIAAINAEGGGGYAGYNDWRVPNIRELQSIVDYGRVAPTINPIFGPTADIFYWSSTSFVALPPVAWNVDFLIGSVGFANEANSFRVRAVRGGR
jgi:hypothetical protein